MPWRTCIFGSPLLVQPSDPAGEMKHDEHVSLFHRARSKFPLEQCHDRARVEIAMTSCSEHFHFVCHAALLVNDEPIDALALFTEMLCFDRVIRIRRSDRISFEFRIDPYDIRGVARRQQRKLEKQQR